MYYVLRLCIILMLFAAGLYSTVPASAQTETETPPGRAALLSAAREIMVEARYCTMITLGEDGSPQARMVDPFPPEEGMVVWIATNPGTRKVAQIKEDRRVTLSYIHAESGSYVTLIGKADLVESIKEKERRWKDEWSLFYKDKNRGSDYLLIRITPIRIETVSFAQGILNDPVTWAPASVAFP